MNTPKKISPPMLIIRPVNAQDLDALLALSELTGFGLTTLPRDPEFLAQRIQESTTSFQHTTHRPHGETYLFVMEDLENHAVVGTCGITSKVGGFEPFYAYKIETSIHTSEMLNVRKEIRTLHLITEHNGPCEIGSLFLHPNYRKDGNGRLLSLARFMFMAQHRQRFDPVVIAEMRGVIDERGQSAFWDALGKHFFDIDFPKADYLSLVNKKFIADLMPKHPIYIPLLPESAQAVIGQVHQQTQPALQILKNEGFTSSGMVDIFEAGPIMLCRRDHIRTVRAARKLSITGICDNLPDTPPALISNTHGTFRATRAIVQIADDKIHIPPAAASALQLNIGDEILLGTLKPQPHLAAALSGRALPEKNNEHI